MLPFEYSFVRLVSRLKRERDKATINRWFAKQGVCFPNGTAGVHINSNIAKTEPHLISIGDHTTVSYNVDFVTHDNSISKVLPDASDLFGKITVGSNCFIGAHSVVMYGVSIADNVIVAAGSVVTKSIKESNVIVGGNPARVITTWEKFAEKSAPFAWNLGAVSKEEMIKRTSAGEKLITR